MKGAKSAAVEYPAERALAARSAATDLAPGAAAAGAAKAPPIMSAPPPMQPVSVQAPQIDPSLPPTDVPPPTPGAAAASVNAQPAPQPVAAAAADAAPPSAAPGASQGVPDVSGLPKGTPVPNPKAPTAVGGVNDPANIDGSGKPAPASALPPPAKPTPPVPTDVQAAATRFMTANLDGVKAETLNVAHMPNVNVIDSPDSLKAGLLQVASDNRHAIDTASRGTVPDAQMIGLAQDLSVNVDTAKQVLGRVVGTNLPSPEVALAARMIANDQVGNLFALSGKVADGTASSVEVTQWQQHQQLVSDFVTQLQGGKAEAGRTLRGLGIKIPGNLPPEVMDHIANVIRQNNPNMEATAKAIQLAGTPSGIANIVHGTNLAGRIGKAATGALSRIFINGILSGPSTWMRIFVGNNFNLALNSADIFAAGIGRGIYGLAARAGGFPTAAEGATISDAVAHLHGVISGGADALRMAGRVLKTGESMDSVMRSQEGQKGNLHPANGPTRELLPEIGDGYFGNIVKGVDRAVDYPGAIIGGIDQFTQTLGRRSYATMMTLKEVRARLSAGTLKPGDAEDIARQMMENQTPEMEQAADAWGHRMTFQTPFPEGGVGEAFQNVLQKAPVLRYIFPFMRTATNIFKQSLLERTPLAVFSSRLRAQIAGGGFEGDLAKSRIATGTAVGSMFAWMAIHDRITGDAPKDPKERGEWELDGRTPYSIRVTNPLTGEDTWRSYQNFEPMASVASATADAVALHALIDQDESGYSMAQHGDTMMDAISNIMASIITNTGDKTFMQGAAKFSEMYNDPKRAFAMWADEMGQAMVPFSGALKFVRNMQDPYMRNAYTLMGKIRDELPTLPGVKGSKALAPRRDVFGEPIKTYSGNSILGPVSPLPSSPSKKDPVTDELQAVMAFTHSVPITMPAKQLALLGAGRGLQDGEGMRLTPREYDRYVTMSRHDPIFNNGTMTFREKLADLIQSPLYQGASPAERAVYLEHVQNQADRIGRTRLFQEDPEFAERMTQWTAQKNRLKYGAQ